MYNLQNIFSDASIKMPMFQKSDHTVGHNSPSQRSCTVPETQLGIYSKESHTGEFEGSFPSGRNFENEVLDEERVISALVAKKKAKKGKKSESKRRKNLTKFKTNATKQRTDSVMWEHLSDQVNQNAVSKIDFYCEARNTWDLGKSLGRITENDDSIVEALARGLKSSKNEGLIQSKSSRRRGER